MIKLRIELEADFADLFEVKDQLQKKGRLDKRIEDGRSSWGTCARTFGARRG